jgi:hypothetical protein
VDVCENNRWLVAHLESRRLDLSLHRCWLGADTATVPLWNLSGQMVGYQQYRPLASKEKNNDPRVGRYFTRLKDRKVGVWGLESWSLSNTLFVCEGLFDAAAVTSLGFSAVAVFGNTVCASTARWFSVLRTSRPLVALVDSDSVGDQLARYCHRSYRSSDYKDPGDCPSARLREVCEQFNL